jgi:hypothetical protein
VTLTAAARSIGFSLTVTVVVGTGKNFARFLQMICRSDFARGVDG